MWWGLGLLDRIQLLPQIEGFSDTCLLDWVGTVALVAKISQILQPGHQSD